MSLSIDANSSQAYYGEESALGVVSAGPWYPLEPNSYSDWGVDTKTVQRSPLNISRQQAKGTVTELDVAAGFQSDMTQNNLSRLLQGFFFADVKETPTNQPTNGTAVAVASVAAGSITLGSAIAAFKAKHLVQTTLFGVPANNGIMLLSAVTGAVLTATNIAGGAPVVEVGPPAAAKVKAVGYRLSPSAALSGLSTGPTKLTDTGGVDFTTLGLSAGQWVYVGQTGNAIAGSNFNFTGSTTGLTVRGYGRLSAISATVLTFDFVTFGNLGDAAATTTAGVDVFFSDFIANQTTLSTIKKRSYTLPRYLGQGVGGLNQLEVLYGNVCDKFTLNIQQASKLTADLTFIGINSGYFNDRSMLTGTIQPFFNEPAINTSRDLFASLLTVTGTVSTSLFGYATDAKFMLDNGASIARALGQATGFDVQLGDFKAEGSVTAYFDDVTAIQAVQQNADTGLTNIFASRNSGFVVDIPLVTLGGGKLKLEKDKKITFDVTASGAANAANFTASYSSFAYLPLPAMSGYAGL